jgi:two-component system NtrC family sensor kinase
VNHQPNFNNVKIVKQLAADLPTLQADPAQLMQVFVNLLNNAADAMPEGGTITVATRLEAGRSVRIEITDTGRGIPEENLSKLFTPFFTTKPVGKGTGLGLSIVYGIIKMHRGQIGVKSRVGQGTTFQITLPLAPAEPKSPLPESETITRIG